MTQDEAIRIQRQALEDITEPIAAMQREVPEGSVLNPHMAVQMADDPEWYKRCARAALAATESIQPVAAQGDTVPISKDGAHVWIEGAGAVELAYNTSISVPPEPVGEIDVEGGICMKSALYTGSLADGHYKLYATPPAAHTDQPTDLSKRLRAIAAGANANGKVQTDPNVLTQAANEIECYYGGMVAWKKTAEKKDRDWNEERMARVNERCADRAAHTDQSLSDEDAYAQSGYRHFMSLEKFKDFRAGVIPVPERDAHTDTQPAVAEGGGYCADREGF